MCKVRALTVDEYLAALAPEFSSDAGRDVFVNMAEQRTNKLFYGEKTNQAIALLAAHIWYVLGAGSEAVPGSGRSSGGSIGTVTSKREGDLSVGFGSGGVAAASVGVGDADLAQSRWGLQLLALRKGCKPFMGVCGGSF